MLNAIRRAFPQDKPSATPVETTLEPLVRDCQDQLRALNEKLYVLPNLDARLLQVQLDLCVQTLLAADPRYSDRRRLNRYERKVFSQFGEDGILDEIFRRIGATNRRFVEFGVEGGLENNTAYQLLRGWSGVWIEPVRHHAEAIEAGLAALIRTGRLRVLNELVTAANVEELFGRTDLPEEMDLLSIDIDSNDYWVWQSIVRFRPRVVVIEYNATFPPPVEWVMPHDVGYRWTGTIMFGASLESLTKLGASKGYRLVGCALGGANAFFVREDLVGEHFDAPYTAEHHYEPARYHLALRQVGHPRCYQALAAAA